MKNLAILFATALISILLFSCDKDDEIITDDQLLGDGSVISGNVTRVTFGFDTVVTNPAREELVLLGRELDDIVLDSTIIVSGEVYYGDGWYATRTDGDGNYLFDNLPSIEFAQIHVITDVDSIEGVDITPDGDEGEQLIDAPINVSVEEDEFDDGNNFELFYFEQLSTLISGQVLIDNNGDGFADDALGGVSVRLYRTDETGNPGALTAELVADSFTNTEGMYNFPSVETGFYSVLFGDQDAYAVISSGDESPDADPLSPNPRYIPVFIEAEERDEDNNFLLERNGININGSMLIDSIGGIGAVNQRVELYARNDEGMPMAPLVASINTDSNGHFWFAGLEPNDYVLYAIGDGTYSCVSGTDISPEAGEPTSPECQFIAVDIPTVETEDSGNIFIVE